MKIKKSRRITVMIENDLYKKLLTLQAKKIVKSERSVAISEVINEALAKAL